MDFIPNIDHYALDKDWLSNRMLLIAGPRQVGKTTYCLNKIKQLGGAYYNWDDARVRQAYAQDSGFFSDSPRRQLIVFDEIHKRHKWKDILKGIFDVYRDDYQFIVSGSAKLDTFRKSGDSLVGRYFLTHIYPLSCGDLLGLDFPEYRTAAQLINLAFEQRSSFCASDFDSLFNLGGFPEPFFKSNEAFKKRWQRQHQELLIREDLRDLSRILSLDKIEKLVTLLRSRVSAEASYHNLAADLEAKPDQVKNWIKHLEAIMLLVTVSPWSAKISRSMRKQPKIYFYDWSILDDVGARFENFVAMQLIRACTLWSDRYGDDYKLHYVRTYDNVEIDFLISKNNKPWLLIEAKCSEPEHSAAQLTIAATLKVPLVVLSRSKKRKKFENLYYLNIVDFLSLLP